MKKLFFILIVGLVGFTASAQDNSMKIPSNGIYWTKDDAGFYKLYVNGEDITKNTVYLYNHTSDAYVYYPRKQLFYKLIDFENLPVGIVHIGQKHSAAIGYKGFWFRYINNESRETYDVLIGIDGTVYDWANKSKKAYYANKVDLVLVLNEDKVVMEDYTNNIKTYTIYPLIDFDESKHQELKKQTENTENTENLEIPETKKIRITQLIPCSGYNDCNKDGFVFVRNSENQLFAYKKNSLQNGPGVHYLYKDRFDFADYNDGFADAHGAKFDVTPERINAIDFNKGYGFIYSVEDKVLKAYHIKIRNGIPRGKGKSTIVSHNNSDNNCLNGDCLNGLGIKKYDEATYIGYFKNGKKEDFGVLMYNDGRYFYGAFKGDEIEGYGYLKDKHMVLRSPFQLGYFKNGKLHGRGIKVKADDKVEEGLWHNGILKED